MHADLYQTTSLTLDFHTILTCTKSFNEVVNCKIRNKRQVPIIDSTSLEDVYINRDSSAAKEVLEVPAQIPLLIITALVSKNKPSLLLSKTSADNFFLSAENSK